MPLSGDHGFLQLADGIFLQLADAFSGDAEAIGGLEDALLVLILTGMILLADRLAVVADKAGSYRDARIADGRLRLDKIGAYLMGLRMKGETEAEILGSARAASTMRLALVATSVGKFSWLRSGVLTNAQIVGAAPFPCPRRPVMAPGFTSSGTNSASWGSTRSSRRLCINICT